MYDDDDPNALLSTAWAALTLEKFAPTKVGGSLQEAAGWEPGIGEHKAEWELCGEVS